MTEIALRGSLRQRQRRTFSMTAAAVATATAVVAVIVGGNVLFDDDRRDRGLPASDSRDVPAPAPSVVAEFDLPADSEARVFTAGRGWIPTRGGHLTRVDPGTNQSEVVLEGSGTGMAVAMSAFDSIWFGHEGKGLFRVNPQTGAVTGRIPENIAGQAAGFGSLWGIDVPHEVLRIDPNTNQVVARLRVADKQEESTPNYLTVHEDSVVVFVDGEDVAVHIDPATNRVTERVKMPATAVGLHGGDGDAPWTMTDRGLVQVDLNTGEVLAQVPLRPDQRANSPAAFSHAVAVNDDRAWVVGETTTTVIDLKRAEVVNTFETPGDGGVLAASFGHGDLWVSYQFGKVLRLDLSDS